MAHQRGVLIRDVTGDPRLGRCLRATVGSDDESAALVQALRLAVEQQRFHKVGP
jgi:histidinol-phosphate/aromatic aminotransferase/cobyric acid decarboxylase-like protein